MGLSILDHLCHPVCPLVLPTVNIPEKLKSLELVGRHQTSCLKTTTSGGSEFSKQIAFSPGEYSFKTHAHYHCYFAEYTPVTLKNA